MNRVTHALSQAVLLAGLAGGLCVPALAVAQEDQPTMQDQVMRFERVEGPDQESVPGGTIMVVAYAVIWCLLLGFVVRLGLLHRGTAQDVGRLERSLAAAIARESKAPAAVKAGAAKAAAKRPETAKEAESSSSEGKKESPAKQTRAESAPKKSEAAEPKAASKSEAAASDDDEDEPESKG
jgi:hypothetical protein